MAFVDLSTAYDTVNHNIMILKLYEMTKDYRFVKIIEILLNNRRFFCNTSWEIQSMEDFKK